MININADWICQRIADAKSIEELDAIMASTPPVFCKNDDHMFNQVVRRRNAAGNYFFKLSCSKCGMNTGGMIKASEVKEYVVYDSAEMDRRWQIQNKIKETYSIRKSMLWNNRREQYREYLDSWEWAEKAYKVKKRANFICEGCLKEPATEVHHKTYDHIYNEFMFELVALCSDCHRRIHDK